jgi:hypothetical protein
MATKHPGKWDSVVFKLDPAFTGDPNSKFDVVRTQVNAIHASIIHNPEFSGDIKWRVLFWRADLPDASTTVVKTRIWNPNYESPYFNEATARITLQNIPPWPVPGIDPLLFCSGHSFLPDGKLLVVGGHIPGVTPFAPGNRYTYIYDIYSGTEGEWLVGTAPEETPQLMTHGRWYPTVTALPNGTMLAMSGYIEVVVSGHLVINDIPAIYDPLLKHG